MECVKEQLKEDDSVLIVTGVGFGVLLPGGSVTVAFSGAIYLVSLQKVSWIRKLLP